MYRVDLHLDSPWLNAAGSLGYLPPARWPVDERMGAFVTNPISASPRAPAAGRGVIAFPGGALVHSGLPNPGLSRVLRKFGERWAQSSLPIWVHLIGSNPDEIGGMVRRIEGREGVVAIELGLPPDARREEILAMVEAAYGELPLVVHLPVSTVGQGWVEELPSLGVSAICLGPPRGTLIDPSGRAMGGRIYGPALLPLTIAAVAALRRLGVPVIAGTGVYSRQDAEVLRSTGAWAVQLDTVLWRGWIG